MNRKKIIQILTIVLLIFILSIFTLGLIFAFMGNFAAAITLFAYNTFFSIIMYFLIRWQKSIQKSMSEMDDQEQQK